MAKIKFPFSAMSDGALAQQASVIIAGVGGDPSFPTPTPTIAVVQEALDAFTNAAAKASAGSKEDKSVRNDKRIILEGLLNKLGMYVSLTANGDENQAVGFGLSDGKKKTARWRTTKAYRLYSKTGYCPRIH